MDTKQSVEALYGTAPFTTDEKPRRIVSVLGDLDIDALLGALRRPGVIPTSGPPHASARLRHQRRALAVPLEALHVAARRSSGINGRIFLLTPQFRHSACNLRSTLTAWLVATLTVTGPLGWYPAAAKSSL